MPADFAAILAEIETLAAGGPSAELGAALGRARTKIETGELSLEELEAFRLLDVAASAGESGAAAELAEALWRRAKSWTFLDRTVAHALIERKQFRAAQLILEALLRRTDLQPFERASCHGHLGRLHKSLSDLRSRMQDKARAAVDRESAAFHYRKAHELGGVDDTKETPDDLAAGRSMYRAWRWGVTNSLGLLSEAESAERECLAIAMKAKIQARLAASEMDYFDDTALAAAHLAVREYDEAAKAYEAMLGRPGVSVGQIQRVLRDMKGHRSEQIANNPALAMMKFIFEAKVLQGLRGAVELTPDQMAFLGGVKQQYTQGSTARQSGHAYLVKWLADGVEMSRVVGHVLHKGDAARGGSAFLMAGSAFDFSGAPCLLVTCDHVLNVNGRREGIAIGDARVRFDRFGGALYEIDRILFDGDSEGGAGLDVTVAKLKSVPEGAVGLTTGNPIQVHDATRTGPQAGGFTAGHPLGAPLSLTLGPAKFTGQYTDWSSRAHSRYLRYTTEARSGNSGGPIFDIDWGVVAVHQVGYDGSGEKAGQGLMTSTLKEIAGPIVRSALGG